ncbi:MAG TPA: hypothetical protein VIP11_16390, partial [Gemmatimonadaceae bacterium]
MKKLVTKSAGRMRFRWLLVPTLLTLGQNCTKLTEVPHDALTPEIAFKNDAEIIAGVAGVYAGLR